MKTQGFPLRSFLLIVGALLALMLVEFLSQMRGGGQGLDVEGTRHLIATCSRSYNQLVALMFVSVAVAIPITATSYTPKQLRLFLSDPIHQAALTFYALAAAHANWALFLVRQSAPTQGIAIMVLATTIVGFAIVVPYFFYVIHFLEPGTIVRRICELGSKLAARATHSERRAEIARERLPGHVYHLGSVVLKSIERADRQSAVDGIVALRALLGEFGKVKAQLPEAWYQAPETEFRGLSTQAREFITAERAWLEVYALQQFIRAFESALTRMPDVVSAVADVVRAIGMDAHERGDVAVLEDVIRTLNSYLRIATRNEEPHAIFEVLQQYKTLAESLDGERPQETVEIARHFATYGKLARRGGLHFISELYVYDMGAVITHAAEGKSEALPELLEVYAGYVGALAQQPTVPLACAVLVSLGKAGPALSDEQRGKMLALLFGLPDATLDAGWSVVRDTQEPRYFEMTHRQVDLNYLPEDRRAAVHGWLQRRTPLPATG